MKNKLSSYISYGAGACLLIGFSTWDKYEKLGIAFIILGAILAISYFIIRTNSEGDGLAWKLYTNQKSTAYNSR